MDFGPMGTPPGGAPKKRGKKKKGAEAEAKMAERMGRVYAAHPEFAGQPPLAAGFFDLSPENAPADGFLALFPGAVVCDVAYPGKEEERETVCYAAGDIGGVSLRRDFGVVSGEIVLKNGETAVLCHATPLLSRGLEGIFKMLEGMAVNPEGFSPDRGGRRGPAVCPKCGRPLRKGAKSCDHCFERGRVLKKLLELAKPYWLGIIFIILVYFLNMGISLITPKINQVLVDDFILNPEKTALASSEPLKVLVPFIFTTLLLLVCHVLTWAVGFLRSMLSMKIGIGTVVDIRKKLYAKVQNLSVSRLEQRTTGEIMRTISGDAAQIQGFVNNWLPNFFQQVIMLAAVCVILVYYSIKIRSWMLVALFLLPVPITAMTIAGFHKKNRKLMGREREAASKTDSALHDILSGIRVVKAYGTEERENQRYADKAAQERDISVKTQILMAEMQPFIHLGLSVGSYFLLYFTGNMILKGALTVGECAMLSSYIGLVYEPLNWLANFPSHLSRTLTGANRVFELLDEEEEMTVDHGVRRTIEGNLTFDNVSFGYDGSRLVLKNIDLEIRPGEMIGLVGRSGVGKSTLINLVMRLYDVDSGALKVDGIDIREYDADCLKNQTGAVLQETVLFSGSLYDNVVYSKPDATVDEVISCCKAAGVHDFALKLPDGYNTKIGEKGYTLSGGERQRVAIARAILRDPKILILDEATSSLDTEMEKQIQDAIEVLIKDRTTIAIAHRLSTLRNATKIVVLDGGRIAETGTHDELMRKKGMYYELVLAQRG